MSSSGWKNKVSKMQKKREETRLTYENNSSWTDKQQNPPVMVRIEAGENRTVHTQLPCFLLTSASFLREKHDFFFLNSQQLLVRLATHFATKEIRSPCKYVFSCVYECVWVCVCGKHEFWPRLLLQRESPGLAACSLDWSWWKTWVTRFTAPRAADENGEVRES